MAYLTTVGSASPSVEEAFRTINQAAIQVKQAATLARDHALSGTLTASDLLDGLIPLLVDAKARIISASSVPGLAAYAQAQFARVPGYDVVGQFTAMMTEINTTIAFFVAGYPKDADGNLKKHAFNQDGSGNIVVYSGFNSAQRTATAQRLNALLATID